MTPRPNALPPSAPATGPVLSEFRKDPDMLELVELFVSELPTRIKAMQEAALASNFEALKRHAHQLKGAGGGYGFPTVSTAAGELEDAIKQAGIETTSATPSPSATPDEQVLAKIRQDLQALLQLCARVRVN